MLIGMLNIAHAVILYAGMCDAYLSELHNQFIMYRLLYTKTVDVK